jgi:hypothetical protein
MLLPMSVAEQLLLQQQQQMHATDQQAAPVSPPDQDQNQDVEQQPLVKTPDEQQQQDQFLVALPTLIVAEMLPLVVRLCKASLHILLSQQSVVNQPQSSSAASASVQALSPNASSFNQWCLALASYIRVPVGQRISSGGSVDSKTYASRFAGAVRHSSSSTQLPAPTGCVCSPCSRHHCHPGGCGALHDQRQQQMDGQRQYRYRSHLDDHATSGGCGSAAFPQGRPWVC